MTAPDAPPVEPLTLTLEEGLKRLWARGFVLVPPDGSTETWGASVADAPDEEWGTWPEAVSAALGRPVVERRDDTAELVEALRVARDRLYGIETARNRGFDLHYAEGSARAGVREIDAALARVKGGELGEGWDEPYAHRDPGKGRPARTARNTRGER